MNIPNRIIAWSRWIDAYGFNRNQLEYVPEKELSSFDIDPNDRYNFDEDDEINFSDNQQPQPIVVTSTGLLPVRPFNNITNFFNFWLGETNFNISENIATIINKEPGIEIFEIVGRYKFRVSIGNCFKFQDVRQSLEKKLNVSYISKEINPSIELDESMKAQFKDIYRIHLKNHKMWALYFLPNGKIDMAHADNESEAKTFADKVDTYVSAKKMGGGIVLKSSEIDSFKELLL